MIPQTKFEALPPKDIRGDTFLVEADASRQILGYGCNNFSSIVLMDLTLRFLKFQ